LAYPSNGISREELNSAINTYNEAQDNLNNLTTIIGGTVICNNIKFNKPFKLTIGNTTKEITQSESEDEDIPNWSHDDIGFASTDTSGLLSDTD
jgi:hypothetical protein